MKHITRKQNKFANVDTVCLVVVSIILFILIFSNMPVVADPVKNISAALMIGLAAFIMYFSGFPTSINYITVILALISALSLIVCSLYGNNYSATYTAIFFLVTSSAWVIGSKMKLEQLLLSIKIAFGAMAIVSILFHFSGYIAMLSPTTSVRWNLRFSPFGMHPNLVGLTFGSAATLFASGILSGKRLDKFLNGFFALLCLSIVLAASARASILGFFLSGIVIYTVHARRIIKVYWRQCIFVAVCLVVGALLFHAQIGSYFSQVFELDSEARGLNSGGSGRTDLWQEGLAAIFSNTKKALFGTGLRSSMAEQLGFSTENSYITIMIDSGVPLGATLILAIVARTTEMLVLSFQRNDRRITELAFFSLFMLFESFFNRYLIGIGNATSIAFLLMAIGFGRKYIRYKWR